MAKHERGRGLIIQLQEAIRASGKSLYRIGKDCSIGTASLYRFMHGERGLSLEAIDRIFEALRLRIVREEQAGQPGGPEPTEPPKKRRPRKEK